MNLSRVRIKNFKGIEEQELLFKPGFNLIKGENGRGKTSILEAIAVGLGGFVAGIPDVATRHISINEIRKEYKMTGDGSCECNYKVPVEIELEARLEDVQYSWTRARTSVKSSRSTTQPRAIVKKAEKMASEEKSELPVLIYEAAGRVWEQKRQKSENPFRKKIVRDIGYTDTLVEASNIKLLRSWCVKMEMSEFKQKKEIAEYEAAKRAVADFMQLMEANDGQQYKVFYDSQLEELMFQKENEILPISDLSAGYQSVIWMAFDIAYRMALLNPQKGDAIAETPGVVLIDEIDMHLHPRWQWNVINALTSTFPNVQFIAATHAPILFASAKDVRVIDIDGDDMQYFDSSYGLDINESVQVFQQTNEMASKVKDLSDKIYDSIDAENFEEAKDLIEKLESTVEENNPIVTKFRTLYDLETMDWEDD